MLESECDTDDDGDIYFLKPVNEYNIVDKIKEANKQLFDQQQITQCESEIVHYVEKLNLNCGRKVTFALNLEDFLEPETSFPAEKLINTDSVADNGVEVEIIEEIPPINSLGRTLTITSSKEFTQEQDDIVEEIRISLSPTPESSPANQNNVDEEEPKEDIDEICEEIIVMDMDSGLKLDKDTEEINRTSQLSNSIEDFQTTEEESSAIVETVENDDEDDDDKYSILVASYLPSDQLDIEDADSELGKSLTQKNFLPKRISFRRMKRCQQNPIHHSHDQTMTNIKFHYRTCCEYRDSLLPEKLPKYTGYLSEYGLSQAQWEKREQKLQRQHRSELEKALKTNEQELRQMQDNDRAFTSWLKNKVRFPINQTQNMFDVKKKVNNLRIASKKRICSSRKTNKKQNQTSI